VIRRTTWLGGVGLGILLLAGCRTIPPLEGLTIDTPLAIDDPRAERVLERHLARAEARPALRGLARVAIEGPDFKLNRPQRIAISRPARLRFEVLGLFDQLAGLLVTNGREYGFFDASTGEVMRGRLRSSLLWDLARIDLEPREVVGILLGAPTPSSGTARAAVWLDGEQRLAVAFAWPDAPRGRDPECGLDAHRSRFDRRCFLGLAALDAGGEIFLFDADDRLVELRALGAGGGLRFRVRFDDFEPLAEEAQPGEPGDFAHRVRLHSPEIGSEAQFLWKRVRLDDELSDRFFELPEGAGSERSG
jgi:hypothetical protein